MPANSPIGKDELRELPGGELLLVARDKARWLLDRLPAHAETHGGNLGGWEEVSRRGRIEHLLPTEHLYDGLEFLRRHLDGEQLFLARRTAEAGCRKVLFCWDLTVAALGIPRLLATGLLLAFRLDGETASRPMEVIVNAGARYRPATCDVLRTLLSHPPATTPPAMGDWSRCLAESLDGEEEVEVYWIGDDGDRTLAGATQRRTLPIPPAARFATSGRRMRLLLPDSRASDPWRQVAEIKV